MSGLLGGGKTVNTSENALSTLAIQTSTQGLPIPIRYGTNRGSANNIWYGNFTPVPHTTSQSSGGGKSGNITTVSTTYTYTCGIAMGICEGPSDGSGIAGIGRVWSNKDVADDLKLGFTEFRGTYPQAAWGYLTTNFPQAALPYAGLAYVANSAFDLGNSNYLPNLSFEVNGLLYTGTGAAVASATLDQSQCNSRIVLSGGNLHASLAGRVGDPNSLWAAVKANVYKSAGKWQFEVKPTVLGSLAQLMAGLATSSALVADGYYIGIDSNGYSYYVANVSSGIGWFYSNGQGSPAGALCGVGDTIGVLYDGDLRILSFRKNGADQGISVSLPTGISFAPALTLWCADPAATAEATLNFGATAFDFPEPGYSALSGSAAQFDVTPAAVLGDILPDLKYGALFPAAQMGPLTDWAAYCTAAGFLCSPAYVTQMAAANIVTELAQIGNAAPVWSEGLLKLVPYADAAVGSYTPNTTINYDLTDDDFIAPPGEDPVKVLRKRPADAFNSVSIECLNRNNHYNIAVVGAKDQANIRQYGLRPMPMISMHAICIPEIAQLVARAILNRVLYFRNTYEFTLGWKYSRLEPMDLVSLTDAGLGLNLTPVRILSTEEDDNGDIRMTAEDFFAGVTHPATYAVQPVGGSFTNAASDPGNAGVPVVFQPPLSISGVPQIWIGAAALNVTSAITPNWGGCEVWLSNDGATYSKAGAITSSAVSGVLTAPLAVGADPDNVNTLSVDLTASRGALSTVPQAQADALITLSYVDGELLAYRTATLTSAYNYNLTYLRRGKEWTNSGAHSAGAKFMRLDSAIFKVDCPANWVGTTLYIKLLSFNSAGAGLQSLADVAAHTYAVQPIGLKVMNGVVPDTVQSYEDLYIPANTVFTMAGRMTNHGRITCKGRLRITN